MLTFDQLQAIPDNVKLGYLRANVEALIQDAPDSHCLKLRAVQARIDGIRRKYPPGVAAGLIFDEMLAMCRVMGNL